MGWGSLRLGWAGCPASQAFICRIIRDYEYLYRWPFPDAATLAWRGGWRRLGECPTIQPRPRSSFGGFSEPGVRRRQTLWLGPLVTFLLRRDSCCCLLVLGQGIFIYEASYSFLRVPRRLLCVMCSAARGCEPWTQQAARVGIYSRGRWSTASGFPCPAGKLPRD